jgi:hypothetical protein
MLAIATPGTTAFTANGHGPLNRIVYPNIGTQETGAKRSAEIFEGIQHPENISCLWSVGVPAGVRVVLGHFIFVYIHPYMDGNGRMGRFLMNVMLAGGG